MEPRISLHRWSTISLRELLLAIACAAAILSWQKERIRSGRLLNLCGEYRTCIDCAEQGGSGGHSHSWVCNGSMVEFTFTAAPFDKEHFPDKFRDSTP